ncbi:tetratricopeptide repeat protein [Tropicimonas isoalkanivorans]|uniref:Tfp pilus assembly protein PilF n=1 Tax=Tropicimonas isoalkanivorans TaxID=441112 RepID=A0A1I1DIN4_9RHOB|nr:hypothetical protein [Tropicimonas isoalkanivorans]SFB72928.1 Tfp pilus assembly protein PilF [Tropicimonas isoalkanivorans]
MKDDRPQSAIPPDARKSALERILASPGFQSAGRLRDFLTYVVEEDLAGRGGGIRGKTIAQDVYGRSTGSDGDPENIVRVDARRLRQQLDQYYATIGASDPVQLVLDPGSYRPRFETHAVPHSSPLRSTTARAAIYAGLFALGTFVGVGLMLVFSPDPSKKVALLDPAMIGGSGQATSNGKKAQRSAIFEKSPAALEAMTLAEQAQSMIFPIFDLPRQTLLTSVFERVIELDPDYYGGYAGLSYVLSTRAILSPDPESRAALVSRSREAADTALRLAPAQAWTQSALAWTAFASRDFDEAMRLAALAEQLDSDNAQILDLVGTIALFTGDFEQALKAVDGGQARVGSHQRFANRNIFAAANYHLGNYRVAYDAFVEAAAMGDPLSAPSLAYQAACLSALGDDKGALRKLNELDRAWPNAPVASMLYGIHSEKANADAVLDRLRSLGWSGGQAEQ